MNHNLELGKCDCHCRWHARCKFDRGLKAKTVGLSVAWLNAGADCDRDMHQIAKEVLSAQCSEKVRKEARASFVTLAVTEPHAQTILDCEAASCGETRPIREPKLLT